MALRGLEHSVNDLATAGILRQIAGGAFLQRLENDR
jgi:hypothetical protein